MRYPAMGCGLSLALKLQRTSAVPSSLLTLLTRPESAGREGSSCPDFTSAALYFGVVLTTTLLSIAMPTLSGVINVPSGRMVPADRFDAHARVWSLSVGGRNPFSSPSAAPPWSGSFGLRDGHSCAQSIANRVGIPSAVSFSAAAPSLRCVSPFWIKGPWLNGGKKKTQGLSSGNTVTRNS